MGLPLFSQVSFLIFIFFKVTSLSLFSLCLFSICLRLLHSSFEETKALMFLNWYFITVKVKGPLGKIFSNNIVVLCVFPSRVLIWIDYWDIGSEGLQTSLVLSFFFWVLKSDSTFRYCSFLTAILLASGEHRLKDLCLNYNKNMLNVSIMLCSVPFTLIPYTIFRSFRKNYELWQLIL